MDLRSITTRTTDNGAEEDGPESKLEPHVPLESTAIGNWATYEMLDDMRMALRVVDATVSTVTIEVEMFAGSERLPLPAVRTESRQHNAARRHAERVNADIRVTAERIEQAGREWDARRIEANWVDPDGVRYARTTWLAADAPLYGILKMEQTADGQLDAKQELIDYGSNADTASTITRSP